MPQIRPPNDSLLTRSISDAVLALYAAFYGHDRFVDVGGRSRKTSWSASWRASSPQTTTQRFANGERGEVIDGRVAFQTDTEDEFTAAIERLTRRRVTAFLSANQTSPGVACELFFLEAPPVAPT